MSEAARPRVLIIDDRADSERSSLVNWEESVEVTVLHPQDVALDDLVEADAVLVDYRLDHWSERDSLETLSLKPMDGLALAAVLRAHVERATERPIALAIRSAHLNDLSGGFPPEPRVHILSRRHNVEWIFPKTVPAGQDIAVHQVATLASAVRRLPEAWPVEDPDETRRLVEVFMAIPDEPWAGLAWQDIEACHPPIHELVRGTHGLAFLRWMLHRILPYPCFLSDSYRLAARLRITHESLISAMRDGLKTTMEPFSYKGELAGFLGPRWWRCGVESFLWELTDGNPFEPQRVRDLLSTEAGVALEATSSNQPVVCIDEDYQVLPQGYDPIEAIRIQPDDWPAYADQCWTTIDLARGNPALRAIVIEADRDRLNQDQGHENLKRTG